eukprot:PITA_28253
MIYVTKPPLFEYQSILVGVHDIQLRQGRTVTPENQKQPKVIVEEKEEEETLNHSLKAVIKYPLPSESLSSSSNQPPFPERLVMERSEPISKTSLASELQNLFIKIPLLHAIKEIPICTKIINELYLKKLGRKKLEPQTIQFVDLGATINVMTKQTMDQLRLSHLRPTPTVLELADRSKIKPEGVLDDVIISLDSWEYPTDFIGFSQKTQ